MARVTRAIKDEDGSLVEIVSCRATRCNHNMGRGKCNIVHSTNGDDKISVDSSGVCVNYLAS